MQHIICLRRAPRDRAGTSNEEVTIMDEHRGSIGLDMFSAQVLVTVLLSSRHDGRPYYVYLACRYPNKFTDPVAARRFLFNIAWRSCMRTVWVLVSSRPKTQGSIAVVRPLSCIFPCQPAQNKLIAISAVTSPKSNTSATFSRLVAVDPIRAEVVAR